MTEPIRFEGVSKSYGDVVALSGVDLELRPGEIHCLVGPNGSGKTTLLDILLGLTRPTSGTVTVPDVPIGCSFQSPTVYPGLTVTENLDVFARLSGCPDEGWRERLLDVFGLDRVAEQPAGTLSGGWQQKLDLALGFLKRPAYLLLDEPCSELDDVLETTDVVCDDQNGAVLGAELPEEGEQAAFRGVVELAAGLVEQEIRGPFQEAKRQVELLLPPARQRAGQLLGDPVEPEHVEQSLAPRPVGTARQAGEHVEVLGHCEPRVDRR